MMNELLIYVDPGFLDNTGHYRNFADNIHDEARKRGVDIWHFVNKDVSEDVLKKYRLEKVFKYKAILKESLYFEGTSLLRMRMLVNAMIDQVLDRLRVIKEFYLRKAFNFKSILKIAEDLINNYNTRSLKSFSEVLKMILVRASKSNYDKISIYMYTSHPLYFSVFAELLNSGKYSNLDIKVHLCLFYLNSQFCMNIKVPKYEKMLKSASKSLEKYDPNQKIDICTDSERTSDRYLPYFNRPLRVFPIPLGKVVKASKIFQKSQKNIEKIIIGFFGYPHIKQGYHLVRKLYQEIIKTPEYSYVYFIIRHNINLIMYDMRKILDDFRKEVNRIIHLVGDLPKDEYQNQIERCDIIVIPHSRNYYPCQTSGLFVDCLRKCKVVIVPEDTWMADMLKGYGAGETFKSDNIASFVNSVKKVCDNFVYYQENAGRGIEIFYTFHTVECLFDTMGIGQHSHKSTNPQNKGSLIH